MLRIFPYIFCLFLLSINPSLSKAPPPGTGSSNVPANILIMLDNSGSMTWDINGRYISSWTKYVRNPRDVETDSNGNIYVMEQNGKYRVFDKDGKSKYTNKGGGYGEGCNQWKFSYDFEIYDDKIYLLDYATSKLKIMSLGGACLANGNRQTGNSYEVASIAVSNNYVFIGGYTQIYQNWIKILNRSNLTQVRQDYQSKWKYNYYSLSGLKINNAENKLLTVSHYVTQPGSKQMVCVHSLSGTTIGECDSVGTENHNRGNGDFMYPVSADFDSNDNIIVNDLGNLRLQKFDSNGDYLSKYTPGRNWSSPFRSPDGIHINSDDKIYVADFSNNDVYEFDSNMSYVKRLGVPPSRMNIAKQVIKTIVNDSDLTGGANFGLMEWGSYSSRRLKLRVPIDKNGATNIFTDIDAVYGGGGTYLLQAMNYAKRYWSGNLNQGGKKYTSPIKTGQNCQLNFNVLISDGQWRSHSSAMAVVRNMKNNTNLKVKTFSVGLAINTGNRRNYDDLAKAGGTEKALYANSANELLQVLKDAILQAISGNLTFTTPAVMSELQKGNFIYQSTFKYEKHKQWEGSLKKYRLKNDGTFDTLQWDAATKLNSKSPGARNIWTAGIGVKNLNNVTTSNRAVLKSALFPNKSNPTDTETDDLINFIRGFDSYDTDSDGKTDDTRHKLADIYNSELVVVGSPEASITDTGELNFSKTDNYYRQQNKYVDFRAGNSCGGSCSNRTEVVLAGANSGLLHAFKSLDGEELWSYIPPNIIGKISSIVTVRSNSTNPIYGIDGSPIVKDVIFDDTPNNGINDPRWRTVLMSGLGSGGHGYFALDITDINNPKHLFTIENDTYNKIINFWDIDENKNSFSYAAGSTVPEQYDYSKLGATWSQPRIIRLKIDGKDKWVAITGGGYNNAVSPDYGSNIYVIDISNGKVLKEIEISDNRIGYHAYSFGIG